MSNIKNFFQSWVVVIVAAALWFNVQTASFGAGWGDDLEDNTATGSATGWAASASGSVDGDADTNNTTASADADEADNDDTDDGDDVDMAATMKSSSRPTQGGGIARASGSASQWTEGKGGNGLNRVGGSINPGSNGNSGSGSSGGFGGGGSGSSSSGGLGVDPQSGTSNYDGSSSVNMSEDVAALAEEIANNHPNAPAGYKLNPLRAKILAMAISYVGKVADQGGTPAYYKRGHDILVDIYQTAYGFPPSHLGNGAEEKVRKSGENANSWCGIFDIAMCKKAGLETARWLSSGGPTGLASGNIGGTNGLVPADVIVINDPKLVHHALLYAIKSDKSGKDILITIDGNSYNQKTGESRTIGFYGENGTPHKWTLNDVWYYYRTVEGPVWVPKDGNSTPVDPKMPNS